MFSIDVAPFSKKNSKLKGIESKSEATSTDSRLKIRGRKPGKKTKKDPNQPKRPHLLFSSSSCFRLVEPIEVKMMTLTNPSLKWMKQEAKRRKKKGTSWSHAKWDSTSSPSAASSHTNNYSQRTLNTLLNASARESQPHLHPRKLNGALWFGINPSVYKFVRTTWQSNFMGPWKNWSDVPEDRQQTWWHTFVQQYYWEARFYDTVYFH